jgi:diguanylate cyclase (GGDEF)-like protein
VLIGVANLAQFSPLEYGVYYLTVFVWIGLTQGRWSCVAFAPLAAAMYVAPLRMLPAAVPMDVVLTSAAIVVPISVLVGEIVAAKVHALTLAQRESEHRAELLRAVSKACRVISTLDRAAVLAAVADALAEIGFGASAFTFFTADGSRYRLEEARNLPAEYERETHEAKGTLTGLVRTRRTTVVLSDYSSADVMHPVLAASQFGATIATPVWVSGTLVGALIATTRERIRFTTQDVEAIELLAAQAGRALENAKTFQTEVAVRHQLIADSTRDVLTGIGNRRHAMTLLESLRTGDALSLIDLDHFKSVNDTYGHAAGDAVLTELGAFLTNRLRDGDDVARFGGEEFLLVLRNADAHQASGILTRLTDDWRRMARHATFSTGYSVHQRGADPAETLGNADSALYAAKAAGRDRVRAFVPTARSKPTGSTRLSIADDGPLL